MASSTLSRYSGMPPTKKEHFPTPADATADMKKAALTLRTNLLGVAGRCASCLPLRPRLQPEEEQGLDTPRSGKFQATSPKGG
jgi:hypothetical protein